jgi:hypothetical protein
MSATPEPKKPSDWQSQAYLDALRPDPGSEMRGAILTSYSADIASIVAALLALAGRDNDKGSGAKSDLAEAIELLSGKVRILIQRGRLARPKRLPVIAGILDQFVRQIDFDEREQSWHPKTSLVEFGNGGATSAWRLWLGSRNLTASVNRDFGLLLRSTVDEKNAKAAPIPGAAEMVARLAAHAELPVFRPVKLKAAINAVRWVHPERLHIERITLTGGEGTDPEPTPPKELDEVIAVSPFLDGGIVSRIGKWGGAKTRRTILSTELALTKIAGQAGKPLIGFHDNLFVLDTPSPEPVEPSTLAPNDGATVEEDESEEIPVGLHAKVFAARKGKHLRLWVGSANATQRAWTGKNVEVIAEITASGTVQEGLNALLGSARAISAATLKAQSVPKKDAHAERLDEARKEFVAEWSGRLVRDGDRFHLDSAKSPHPSDPDVKLAAGLATGMLIEWPRNEAKVFLGEYAVGLHTQLVQFRLSLDALNCVWLQYVEVTPPFDADRDRRAIARHLGMHAFLKWVASLLMGEGGSEGGDLWDDPPGSGPRSPNNRLFDGSILTLDAMLACWARDPAAFRRVSKRVDTYLGPVVAEAGSLTADEREELQRFQDVWKTVSDELLKDR